MIIGISGRKQSGKDTVCRIIQYLMFQKINTTTGSSWSYQQFIDRYTDSGESNASEYRMSIDQASLWQRKLFADKLKDIVCLLINCNREQLEDNEFKEKELGKEWQVWYVSLYKLQFNDNKEGRFSPLFTTKEEAEICQLGLVEKYGAGGTCIISKLLTPRSLLQLIGTETGRNIIHPNIWCNSLFSEYYGDTEEWKLIVGFEDSYEVSSFGNVRSLNRKIIYGTGKGDYHTRGGQILKPTLSNGYATVSLSGNTFTVHDLVGRHFLSKLEDSDYVLNHIDYNKENNFYKNLEYVTQKDNIRHNYKAGRANIGEKQKDAKLTESQVIGIRELLKAESQANVARVFNISTTTINDIAKGRKWAHVGRENTPIEPILPITPPNWIITDVRFPNELKAIEDKGGLVIRINNPRIISTDTHFSETALDNNEWRPDRFINNDGTIEDLIDKVRFIIEKENL